MQNFWQQIDKTEPIRDEHQAIFPDENKNELPAPISASQVDVVHQQQRQAVKAQRMLQRYIDGQFDSGRHLQRVRFRLIIWVLRNKISSILKRYLDIFICLLLVPFLLPLMALIALLIRLDSPGPILYRQERVGRWGKKFDCFKFRSMYVGADEQKEELMQQNEADEIIFKMKNDPRITRVGRHLRKFSLDELPQFFNVYKGEMSLVGPRPPVPSEVENYPYDYFRRLDVPPGITGLQQVSGRSDLPFKRWVELDLQYIEEQSLAKDVEILLRTIPAVVTGRGAY